MPHSLSSLFLKQLVVSASTTLSGRLFNPDVHCPLTVEEFPDVETNQIKIKSNQTRFYNVRSKTESHTHTRKHKEIIEKLKKRR